MNKESAKENPGMLNLFQCKCPRCRLGDMFENKKPYSRGFMKMYEKCKVCGQYFDIEVGFYYGSSYVSYGIAVAISVATLIVWWLLIGISANDDRIFYWLIFNAVFILALQPILMRISRTFWLAMIVKYDPEWRIHPAEVPERTNEEQKNNW